MDSAFWEAFCLASKRPPMLRRRWWRRPWRAPSTRRASRWPWPARCWSTSQRPMMDSIHCWMLGKQRGKQRWGRHPKAVLMVGRWKMDWYQWQVEWKLDLMAFYVEFWDDCLLTKWLKNILGSMAADHPLKLPRGSRWPSQSILTLIGNPPRTDALQYKQLVVWDTKLM